MNGKVDITEESPYLRLARYLKAFVRLRTTTVRDVAKYESVLWFSEIPQERDCLSAAWTDEYDAEAPWLEVKKQQFEKVPDPPKLILPWINEKALKTATPQIPPLLQSIRVPDDETGLTEGEDSPIVEYSLRDNPKIQQAYEVYRPRWEKWSEEHRRREAIQDIYAKLFSLHTQIRKQNEIIEVVLGMGLLDWRVELKGKIIPIRRHTVVGNVELVFDPAKGVIRVVPPGDGARLRIEEDMLEAQLRPDRSYSSTVEEQLDEIGDAIWDKRQMHTALKNWADALSADSVWSPELYAQESNKNAPALSFAPALILRKRTQTGMARIYDNLIAQLSDDTVDVPQGWNGLVNDVEDHIINTDEDGQKSRHKRSSKVYFPLLANREQKRIIEAINRQRGVLVQGPPGTGKSHTIANLMCHLLATGKRVLITAETGRALQVLKNKLPKEIQPLCVSLLGQGGDAFAELNAAVHRITARQASYSPGDYDDKVSELDKEIDKARRDLAKIDTEIRSLREEEACPHSVGQGIYHGTVSAIAERVAGESEQYNWLQLAQDAPTDPPLSNERILAWLTICRSYTDEQLSDANLQISPSVDLLSPHQLAGAIEAEAKASKAMDEIGELFMHEAYTPLRCLSTKSREILRKDLQDIERLRLDVYRVENNWIKKAIRESLAGQRAHWDALLKLSKSHLTKIQSLLSKLGERIITLPDGIDAKKAQADAKAALRYLSEGGKWKRYGLITPKILKGRTYLRDILVDGEGATTSEALQSVCDYLALEHAYISLQTAWSEIGISKPEGNRHMRIAILKEREAILEKSSTFIASCQRVAQRMVSATPPIPEPSWLDGQAQKWLELIEATFVKDHFDTASTYIEDSYSKVQSLRNLHDVHPLVATLLDAVAARDSTAYSQCHAEIVSIEKVRTDQKERMRVENIIKATVSDLVDIVAANVNDEVWKIRFSVWQNAWHWAVANAWLEKRSDLGYQQKLLEKRHETDTKIGVLLAEIVALRAWIHFFDRLSPRETAALKSWREAVRVIGKGTGRSAKMARLRREARKYMDMCRDAIPIWIMPRYLVAEMLDPTPDRYDLVIVDEASQLGIESLFLFYIAKKIVVVGDDQQISPYGVGVPDAEIERLRRDYLDSIPHQHVLTAQSSFYSNAKIRFSQNIVLREHFRCMPEIIQFSNRECYECNGTPLDPLRAYPANRLQPLVLRHVADGYREGNTQNAQNPPEADLIVNQIAACIKDPRYAQATMGVISLQGEAQAKLIERKLLTVVDPEEIERRRLICGDAYAFQGDERTIIFLSMVAAPGEIGIRALTDASAKQRFNVAVSRAQDQLWLFHTAKLDVLSPNCMRYKLLSYMLDPSRRTAEESEQRFDSNFERDVSRIITAKGFYVRTQVCVGDTTNHRYRIDLVVEGMQGKLAVECDGDTWHGPERYEQDMARQRDLERAGWQFVRIRGGDFYRDPEAAMQPVWSELDRLGIKSGGIDKEAAEPPTIIIEEKPSWNPPKSEFPKPGPPQSGPPTIERENNTDARGQVPYREFKGKAGPDPRQASPIQVSEGLCQIIKIEGPMLAKRAYDVYLRGCEIRRMGKDLKHSMDTALQHAIRRDQVVKENESGKTGLIYSIVRAQGTPFITLRDRGPRTFEEIPPSELQLVARRLANEKGFKVGSDAHLRAILDVFNLKRLTLKVGTTLLDILDRQYPYVDQLIREIGN